jgi:hypothetical protein
VVRFGRTVPIEDGFLPIFSVDTEEEAKALLILTCSSNMAGEYIARELAQEQTLENLYAFGDRLRAGYERIKARNGSSAATRRSS